MKLTIPYEEATPTQKLRAYWADFCDADAVPPDFADEMESAGLVELQWLDEGEAQATVDADMYWRDKFGDEMPSSVYVLTPAGRAALEEQP